MAIDFRALQIQTKQIIASGSLIGTKLVIYPASAASTNPLLRNQGFINESVFNTTALSGSDIFMYVSGAIGSKNGSSSATSVYGGDVHVSGTLYVGRSVVSNYQVANPLVNETMTGETFVSFGALELTGTLGPDSKILGGTVGLTDVLTVELYNNSDGTTLAQWSCTGVLDNMTLDTTGTIDLPGDWCMFRMKTNSPTGIGIVKGIYLVQDNGL